MHTIQISRINQTLDDSSVRFVAATSMSVDAEVRAMPRPQIPNYAVRRLGVGIAAIAGVFLIAIASVGALAGLGSSAAVASTGSPAASAPSATVAETGDTMWSIAGDHRGDVGRDRYLEALIRKNGSTEIRVGQVIWLP